MPFTRTEVATMAVSHLGSGEEIEDIDTDDTKEARALRAFEAIARRKFLAAHLWPRARKIADLTLVEADPTDEWDYSYVYPTDCLYFRRILSGTRKDNEDTYIPFLVADGDASTVIYTDQVEATGEWTKDLVDGNGDTDFSRWTDDMVFAFSLFWAHYAAARILGGDPGKIGARCFDLYLLEASKAMANSANEQKPDPPGLPKTLRVRDS